MYAGSVLMLLIDLDQARQDVLTDKIEARFMVSTFYCCLTVLLVSCFVTNSFEGMAARVWQRNADCGPCCSHAEGITLYSTLVLTMINKSADRSQLLFCQYCFRVENSVWQN